MSGDGEVLARHYATGLPMKVSWRGGRLLSVKRARGQADPDCWLAPSLVDLQINGFAGVDFQQDNLDQEQLLLAVRALRQSGCGRFLLTLVTDDWPKLMERLQHFRSLREHSVELCQAIAGWHLEGPFLSQEPGFCGAHNPDRMCDPRVEHLREVKRITGHDPVLLTLAPERTGALEAVALAVKLGFRASLGHTNASAETLLKAVQAGASGFTHFGNACPQQLDRHDNILWRVLDTPGLTLSLIPDAIHVSPMLFRLVHRAWPAASLFYTTDAMAAAGAAPGRYSLGRLQVEVGQDQIVRQPGRSNYAGSALRPIDGVLRAARMLGKPWQAVWDLASTTPARFMGWASETEWASPLCLLRFTEAQELVEVRTLVQERTA